MALCWSGPQNVDDRRREHDETGDVRRDRDPEDAAERAFDRLVPQRLLGEQCTGPAAGDGDEVQGRFGNALPAGAGRPFVDGVDDEVQGCERGENEIAGQGGLGFRPGADGGPAGVRQARRR